MPKLGFTGKDLPCYRYLVNIQALRNGNIPLLYKRQTTKVAATQPKPTCAGFFY